ncbi:MAG: hypothetical protein M1836_003070 [Candelina mexicana]|nr:MAG: hypothetical protein M1836_003070 [Candelina mexicana]
MFLLPISISSLLYGIPSVGLGLYLTFKAPTPPKITSPPQRAHDTTLLGFSLSAFGLVFLTTPSLAHLNLPPLHLSLASLALLTLLTEKRKRADPYTRLELSCLIAGELLPLVGTYAFSVLTGTAWILRPKWVFDPSKINLPWPLKIHTLGLIAVGLFKAFQQPSPSLSEPDTTATGIMGFGLGLAYLLTSSAPIAENQWLAACAPVRMLIGVLAGTVLVVKRNRMRKETRNWLRGITIYDFISGALTGWWLGNYSGRVGD